MTSVDRMPKIAEKCRLCGANRMQDVFSLGEQYVSDFVKPEDVYNGIKCPITISYCAECTLVQQRYTAPQEILYTRQYWYRSGVTKTMRRALRDVTESIENRVTLKSGDIVLDIGSNDGTLLRSYGNPNLITVGVEPAVNLAEKGSEGVNVFLNDFWNSSKFLKATGGRKAKVVTACGMFYDLEDPVTFIQDVAEVLDENGIFVAQLMCLENMLSVGDLGNLTHEHIEFYTLRSLFYLFARAGLEIFSISTNAVNGQSYRFYATHAGRFSPDELLRSLYEIEGEQDTPEILNSFYQGLDVERDKTLDFIDEELLKGKTFYVYGASTKGNVLLQWYGLTTDEITAAADRSPEKWGRCTVGTGIPIISEERAREANPDYFFVLPYAFLTEFKQRESEWLSRGGKFIVSTPRFEVIN